MLPRIYLIRHGETEWSLSGQHTRRKEILLTAPCLFCAVEEWKGKRARKQSEPKAVETAAVSATS